MESTLHTVHGACLNIFTFAVENVGSGEKQGNILPKKVKFT